MNNPPMSFPHEIPIQSPFNPHSITVSSDQILQIFSHVKEMLGLVGSSHGFPIDFPHGFPPWISRGFCRMTHPSHCQLVAAVAAAALFGLLSPEPLWFLERLLAGDCAVTRAKNASN